LIRAATDEKCGIGREFIPEKPQEQITISTVLTACNYLHFNNLQSQN